MEVQRKLQVNVSLMISLIMGKMCKICFFLASTNADQPKVRVKGGVVTTTYVLQSCLVPPPRKKRLNKVVRRNSSLLSNRREMKKRRKSLGTCICS